MNRYLRTTIFPPDLKPTMFVVGEADVTMPLEEIGRPEDSGEWFVKQDIFQHESGDIAMATVVAMGRMNAQKDTERNQAIMFHWLKQKMSLLKDGGVLGTQKPAPFTADEIREVFAQLVDVKEYRSFTLQATAQDGTFVEVKA